MTKCHCGRVLHYADRELQATVQKTIDTYGENIAITDWTGKTYLVPRHYVALHGIDDDNLGALGFRWVLGEDLIKPSVLAAYAENN